MAFWGLRLFAGPRGLPPHAQTVGAAETPRGDVARLLGKPEAAATVVAQAPAPSRFKLIGVITPRRDNDIAVALAVISIDEQPAKAYRVGAVLDGQTVLREVRLRGASIGPRDGTATALELPPPATAKATTLPPIVGATAQTAAAPRAALPQPVLTAPPPTRNQDTDAEADADADGPQDGSAPPPVPPPAQTPSRPQSE